MSLRHPFTRRHPNSRNSSSRESGQPAWPGYPSAPPAWTGPSASSRVPQSNLPPPHTTTFYLAPGYWETLTPGGTARSITRNYEYPTSSFGDPFGSPSHLPSQIGAHFPQIVQHARLFGPSPTLSNPYTPTQSLFAPPRFEYELVPLASAPSTQPQPLWHPSDLAAAEERRHDFVQQMGVYKEGGPYILLLERAAGSGMRTRGRVREWYPEHGILVMPWDFEQPITGWREMWTLFQEFVRYQEEGVLARGTVDLDVLAVGYEGRVVILGPGGRLIKSAEC